MIVGEPKFHSWGRCTIALTNMHSDLRSNLSSGLCINLDDINYIIYVDPLFRILGCNNIAVLKRIVVSCHLVSVRP